MSFTVLVMRILQYVFLLKFYADILYLKAIWGDSTKTWEDIEETFVEGVGHVRYVCVWFLAADFAKYALGFFQLASMAELAIVIKFSAI